MTFKLVLAVLAILFTQEINAQVNNPSQVAQQGATDHANNDMSNSVDNGLNKGENAIKGLFKKKPKNAKTDSTHAAAPAGANGTSAASTSPASGTPASGTAAQTSTPSLKAYSNYDFVPGERILFEDNFSDDQVGEFPAHWRLGYGQAVISSFDGKKVFALTEGEEGDRAVVMEPRLKLKSGYLPSAFTVELDFYISRDQNAETSHGADWVGLNFFGTDEPINTYDELNLNAQRLELSADKLWAGTKELPDDKREENFENKWHHLAIAYRDHQMKIYLDQDRLYVIPEVKDTSLNKFGVRVSGKCVVTNIRLAAGGGMNMLGKKFTDSKIVTHGINFDVDKATIKPESMGTLNMIVQVLKDNPGLTFEVGGHTDNSGNGPHNLQLSQQRADAVKTQLVAMGVDGSRLAAKGWGDTKPVADNSTLEGKANNRRVEFVRTSH